MKHKLHEFFARSIAVTLSRTVWLGRGMDRFKREYKATILAVEEGDDPRAQQPSTTVTVELESVTYVPSGYVDGAQSPRYHGSFAVWLKPEVMGLSDFWYLLLGQARPGEAKFVYTNIEDADERERSAARAGIV